MNMTMCYSLSRGCRRLSVNDAWRGRLLPPRDSRGFCLSAVPCLFRQAGQRLFSSAVNFDKISTKVLLKNCQNTSRCIATRFPTKIYQCRSFNSMKCNACFSKLLTGFRNTERYFSQYVSTRNVKCLTLLRNYCTKAVPQTVTKAGVPLKRPIVPKSSDIKRLLGLAGPEKWRLTGGLLLLLVSSGVTMAVPFCLGKVIDVLQSVSENSQMKEKLKKICQILVVVFLIGGVANFGRVYLMQVSGQNIVKRLRELLFSSIMRQEIGFFDKTKTGELINRLSADTSLVGQSVTMNISDGLRATAQAFGGVGMMFFVSPQLTGIALGIVPPIAALSIVYGRYVKKITTQVQDTLASATDVAEERIGNIRTVRAFAHEQKECEAYSTRVDRVLKLAYKEAMARGLFFGSTGLSGNLIVLSVFYYGGMMMTESQITIGDLSSFLLYAAYVGISIAGLSSFYTELMRGLGASTRIWELIDKAPAIPLYDNSLKKFPIEGNITFNNVTFAYPSRSDLAIFREFSLTVPSGSVTAVVGSSGSGKSTLAALVLRYYDPKSGSIMLDGHDIKKIDPSWLRRQIGTVSQEPALFSCSIADNIAYGVDDPSEVKMEDIIEAAKKSNAHTFIESFPEGYNTMVGERGVMLSGGQKQRIAIARAILKDPKILLLDEATSALDSQSEFYVQEALERLMVGRTVVTIAHRLSTIKSANQIAVFHDGQVAEIGSYGELMRIDNGIFQGLVHRQTITN